MTLRPLRIFIVDDQDAYFTEEMLDAARALGYGKFIRLRRVSAPILRTWLDRPPDIVILDVKGVADPEVAKDGFGIADRLLRDTNTYVVITSAHQYHLRNVHLACDYVLEDRLLTVVDFLDELDQIVLDYATRKMRFYRGLAFRVGRAMIRGARLHQ